MDKYILNGKQPVAEPDLMKWAVWFESSNRLVKVSEPEKNIKVSTVFLGIDHSFGRSVFRTPILFETMIFGGEHDGYQERYSTWIEAEKGHEKALLLIFE